MEFASKKVIIWGERDGIASPSIAKCLEPLGAQIILSKTDCFV